MSHTPRQRRGDSDERPADLKASRNLECLERQPDERLAARIGSVVELRGPHEWHLTDACAWKPLANVTNRLESSPIGKTRLPGQRH